MNFLSGPTGCNASNSSEHTLTHAFPTADSARPPLLNWKILALQLTFLMKNEWKRAENTLVYSMTPTFLSFFMLSNWCWLFSFLICQESTIFFPYHFLFVLILISHFALQVLWSKPYISLYFFIHIYSHHCFHLLVFIFSWFMLYRSWSFYMALQHFLFLSPSLSQMATVPLIFNVIITTFSKSYFP